MANLRLGPTKMREKKIVDMDIIHSSRVPFMKKRDRLLTHLVPRVYACPNQ